MTQVRAMVEEGADGIDVGGESTRPQGASTVSAEEEIRRVMPVVSAIRDAFPDILLSIDTTKAEVAATLERTFDTTTAPSDSRKKTDFRGANL